MPQVLRRLVGRLSIAVITAGGRLCAAVRGHVGRGRGQLILGSVSANTVLLARRPLVQHLHINATGSEIDSRRQ